MLGTAQPPSSAAAVTAAGVAGAAAAAVRPAAPPATALGVLRRALSLLRSHLLPVLLVYGLKDAAAFVLHRITQRLTNAGTLGDKRGSPVQCH